jgi:hypothetical protein
MNLTVTMGALQQERAVEREPFAAQDSVRFIDPAADGNWDSKVMSHPECSFFHSAAWAKVLKEAYGFRPCYAVLGSGGGLQALLPMMETRSWLNGCRGVSLPFTDECMPLLSDPRDASRLLAAAKKCGESRKWKHLEHRGGAHVFDSPAESVAFYGHKLRLDCSEEQMFGQFTGALRRAIRKGQRAGITVEISSSIEAVKSFFALHCRTRNRHGLPPQPFSFFRCIHKHVIDNGLGFVAVAKYRGRAVAAAIYFFFGTQAIFKFGASEEGLQELRGNNVTMWEAIKWLARNGFTELSLGRTSLNSEGLRRFKQGWGAEEYRVSYSNYDFRLKKYIVDKDWAFGWHNQMFRMMPIFFARLVGAVLYRHTS